MTDARRPLIAGNWKMNGLSEDGRELARALAKRISDARTPPACDIAVAPPATILRAISAALAGSPILVGGQDCHANASGAHTGDISAGMLKDAGAVFAIVGHSERRQDHGEKNHAVRAKAEAALRQDLLTIICVGETETERDAGDAVEVVVAQVDASLPSKATSDTVVVAYEPVWAIGTGRTPTLDEIAGMHGAIRAKLADRFKGGGAFRILYGGSVKPANAEDVLALSDVDGALVGGASLKAEDFWAIAEACA